jgi:hypothetical protein
LYKILIANYRVLVLPLQPADGYLSPDLLPQVTIDWVTSQRDRLQNDLNFVSALVANCSAVIGSANSITHLACATQPEKVTVGIKYGNRFPYWRRFDNAAWYPGSTIVRQTKEEREDNFYQRLLVSAAMHIT